MEKIKILLCCGAGMSSGFLAQQMRIAAKKASMMIKVEAKSQSNIDDDLPTTSILLIGPHLTYAFDDLKKKCDPYKIPVMIIPQEVYAGLDGTTLLNMSLECLKEKIQ